MADSSISTKRCTKCRKELPATPEYFSRDAHKKSGLRPHCKICTAEYRAAHRKESAEYIKRYQAEHSEETNAKSRRYKATHREEQTEYRRRYYAANAETKREYAHRYHMEHRGEDAEYRRNHRAENAIKGHRHRARKHRLPDTFTGDQAKAALIYWRWKCAYCGANLAQLSLFDDIKLHFDHYIAVSDPRLNNPGTAAENMLPTCAHCNKSKCDAAPIVWVNWKFPKRAKAIIKRIEAYFEYVVEKCKS